MRTCAFKLIVTCKLDDQYFEPWAKLTTEQQDILLDGEEANCAGEDERMGYWCHTCRFCENIESFELRNK